MTTLPRRLKAHVDAALALDAARPDWGAGLRAAAALMLPLAVGWAFEVPALTWVSMGGWLGILADPGGSYRERAEALGAFVPGVLLSFVAGSLAGALPHLGIPALFVFALLCSLLRVRGDSAGTLGVLFLISYCIAMGYPGGLIASTERAGLVAAGGLWAMLLSLPLWAFRPYAPVRQAVAACWTALADLAEALSRGEELAAPQRLLARQALERARGALGVARAGRHGETGRGEQLLVLYGLAELGLGGLGALSEALQSGGDRRALLELVAAQRAVALAIPDQRGALQLPAAPAPPEGEVGALLARLHAEARQAVEAIAALNRGAPSLGTAGIALPQDTQPSLRDALQPGSVELQHALRVAIVCTLGALASAALHLHRAYWVTITIVIILQPHAVATVRRALQRVGGTLLGAVAAAVLARWLRAPLALAPVLALLSVVAVALRRLNYAVFAALLTPVFVLMAEAGSQDWSLTRVRIVDTLIGGALALLGALVLWPTRELERMPAILSHLLEADRSYLATALRGAPEQERGAARRRVGVAAANAEAALQRLLGEHPDPREVEPIIALVAYGRRLAASITALSAQPALLRELPQGLDAALASLSQAAQASAAPPGLPALEAQGEPALRVVRQVRVLHQALQRLSADATVP